MHGLTKLAAQAATATLVTKLASDSKISPELVHDLARQANLPTEQFVKLAYADPKDYVNFLNVATGVVKPTMIKEAKGPLLSKLLQAIQSVKGTAQGMVTPSAGSNAASRFLEQNAVGAKTPLGRAGYGVATGGTAGYVGNKMLNGGGGGSGTPSAETTAPAETPAAKPTPKATAPAQTNGPAANPAQQGAEQPSQGGMSNMQKGLLGGAALGVGGLGLGAAMRKRKQKTVTASDRTTLVKQAMRRVLVNRVAKLMHKQAADNMVNYLDKLALVMPIEKAASVRTMQRELKTGKPLVQAIKVAFPVLTGEERGVLAFQLCKLASDDVSGSGARIPMKTVQRQEMTVKLKGKSGGKALKQMS